MGNDMKNKSFSILLLVLLFIPIEMAFCESDPSFVFVTLKTSMGNIKLKLFRDEAPRTVETFIGLVTGSKTYNDIKTGKKTKDTPFYKNMIFHKVHPDLGIQTGCPLGNGKGWPGFTIKDEKNDIKFDRGFLVAMSKIEGNPDSAGSQFFITVKPVEYLNGKYTVIGEVVDGHEIVKKVSEVKRDAMMKPVEPVRLFEVLVDEK